MRLLKYLIPLALFVVLAGFLFRGLSLNPREVPSPLIGKPAPAFSLPRLDDPQKTLSTQDLRGKVYVLNVWASWCAPCREEHPLIVDFARRSKVPVYGLNYKDKPGNAQAWLKQLGDPYKATLIDFDGRTGIDFGVYGVPETFIVDAQGVIRFKHIGPLSAAAIRDKLEPAQELGA